jgi:hypothetical protein
MAGVGTGDILTDTIRSVWGLGPTGTGFLGNQISAAESIGQTSGFGRAASLQGAIDAALGNTSDFHYESEAGDNEALARTTANIDLIEANSDATGMAVFVPSRELAASVVDSDSIATDDQIKAEMTNFNIVRTLYNQGFANRRYIAANLAQINFALARNGLNKLIAAKITDHMRQTPSGEKYPIFWSDVIGSASQAAEMVRLLGFLRSQDTTHGQPRPLAEHRQTRIAGITLTGEYEICNLWVDEPAARVGGSHLHLVLKPCLLDVNMTYITQFDGATDFNLLAATDFQVKRIAKSVFGVPYEKFVAYQLVPVCSGASRAVLEERYTQKMFHAVRINGVPMVSDAPSQLANSITIYVGRTMFREDRPSSAAHYAHSKRLREVAPAERNFALTSLSSILAFVCQGNARFCTAETGPCGALPHVIQVVNA